MSIERKTSFNEENLVWQRVFIPAILFLLLSCSPSEEAQEIKLTQTPEFTATLPPTITSTLMLTETPVPTVTFTLPPLATSTEIPTATPTPEPSPTLEPTATPTAIETQEPTPTETEIPEPIPTPSPTRTPKPTPTPAPTATTKPTEQPAPPEAPSGQICGVGRSEGKCWERTEKRKGVLPSGEVVGNGGLGRYYPHPDIKISGKWMLGGRVERIEGNNIIYLRGQGEDIIKIRIAYDSPYFYAVMDRFAFGRPWDESLVEVRPLLGRDIIGGDYLTIALSQVGRNDKNSDENYQMMKEMLKTYGVLRGYLVQIYQ